MPHFLDLVYGVTELLVLETVTDDLTAEEYWDFMHQGAFYPYGQSLEDIMTPPAARAIEILFGLPGLPL